MEIKNNYSVNSLCGDIPDCPFEDGKENRKCWPNNIFNENPKCDVCPDYLKNYNQIVYDDIIRAEQNPNDNIHHIRKEVKEDGGKYIKFFDDYGVLVGASVTIEDYYWVYINSDRKLCFSSCVGKYELVEENELPPKMSVLVYLMNYDRESLRQLVNKKISEYKFDKLITDIYI